MLGCYLDHVPPHLNQTVHCCVYSRCSWYITLCNIKAQIHILAMSTCCACSLFIVAMFYPIPPCTPGKLLGISCPPSSHSILPPSTNHPGKPAREAKPNCILWKYTPKAVAHHLQRQLQVSLDTYFWEQTPQALQALPPHTDGFWTPQNEDQYSQLSTEHAGNAFSWHNSLTTLCLSMYKTYLCLCVLPQTYHQEKYMIYVADGTMHTKVFTKKASTLFDQEIAQITN